MDLRTPQQENDEDEKPLASDYPAEKARQGVVILKHRWQRIVFVAGLVAVVLIDHRMALSPGALAGIPGKNGRAGITQFCPAVGF